VIEKVGNQEPLTIIEYLRQSQRSAADSAAIYRQVDQSVYVWFLMVFPILLILLFFSHSLQP